MNIRAIGPYSQVIKLDKTILVSGQRPVNPKTWRNTRGYLKVQTKQSVKNVKEILTGASLEEDVVKTQYF